MVSEEVTEGCRADTLARCLEVEMVLLLFSDKMEVPEILSFWSTEFKGSLLSLVPDNVFRAVGALDSMSMFLSTGDVHQSSSETGTYNILNKQS